MNAKSTFIWSSNNVAAKYKPKPVIIFVQQASRKEKF